MSATTITSELERLSWDLVNSTDDEALSLADLQEHVRAVATQLSGLALAVGQIEGLAGTSLCEREDVFPTPAQSLALGRFMGQVMRDDQFDRPDRRGYAWARVARGGLGLSQSYLSVVLGDNYEGGIDREGRVSS